MSVGVLLVVLSAVVGLIIGRRYRDEHTIQQALAASDIETDDDNIVRGLTEGTLTVEELQDLGLDPKPYVRRQRALEGVKKFGKAVRKAGITLTVEGSTSVEISGDLRNVEVRVKGSRWDRRAPPPEDPVRAADLAKAEAFAEKLLRPSSDDPGVDCGDGRSRTVEASDCVL